MTFWPTSQEQKFSQIWGLCSNTASNINFHYRTNSVKINDQIFQEIQKTPFLEVHSPNFGGKKFFLENPALSHTTSYGFWVPCQNLDKTNDTIPRKCLDRRKEGPKDGQTLFYRTLQATAGGPIRKYHQQKTWHQTVVTVANQWYWWEKIKVLTQSLV